MKFCPLFLLIFLVSCQAPEPEAPADPDELYFKFVEAYDKLDATALSERYVSGATLLNLYDGVTPGSVTGKPAIYDYFNNFFNQMRGDSFKLSLTFKVANREKEGDSYYDNGFYQLDYRKPGKSAIETFGKFSTILVLDKGEWKFNIDATTNTEAAEYESVEVEKISLRE